MPGTSARHAKLTVTSGEKVNANILTIRGRVIAGRKASSNILTVREQYPENRRPGVVAYTGSPTY